MTNFHGDTMDLDDRVIRRLKMSDLRMLLAVVQWGSMSKAAAHLNISQSAVSKALGELEHTLGVRLLDRNPQGIEPTVYGQALVKRAITIFDEVRQGVKDIEFLTDPTAGAVWVGCSEPIATGLLPAIVERLGRQYPRIVCHVVQTPTTATLEYRELRDRQVEVLLGRIKEPFSDDDLQADVLFHQQLHVVAGRRSKWARRRKIELAELVDEPWLLPLPNTWPRSLIEDAFHASGLRSPRAGVASLSFNLYNSLLRTGRYLTALPGSVLYYGALRSLVKLLPVEFPNQPRPIAVITLKHRTLSPIAQLFIDCAREIAKPLIRRKW
jgi:DNA-binding transcriptional LysR family regulator